MYAKYIIKVPQNNEIVVLNILDSIYITPNRLHKQREVTWQTNQYTPPKMSHKNKEIG